MKKYFLLVSLLLVSYVYGQAPADYYKNAEGLTGLPLKTALYNIIKGHTTISYDGLYAKYVSTDNFPGNNKVWDMYSMKADGTANYWFTNASSSSDKCGSYSKEGDCYNREHSTPASWFSDASPMYSDLFNVYPTDGYVNNRRSNYPMATVGSATWTSSNGSKLGSCGVAGYTGTVFEPIDEYKGDFARTFLYMATRYEDKVANWPSNTPQCAAVYAGNNGLTFKPWYITMLLAWHALDPVSQKEIDRNNAVYAVQKNRNPYIDHPEWVECIWSSCTTGINDSENEGNFVTVYPNPTSGNVTVSYTLPSASVKEIELFTIDGKLLLTNDCADLTENTVNIATSDIPNGIYFIKIITNRSAITKQLIIQKQ